MQPARRGADILAVGFGATVAIWSLLYLAALPPGNRVVWTVIAVLLPVVLLAAGFHLGRRAGRGPAGGAAMGAVIAVTGLLVVLGLPAETETGRDYGTILAWAGGLLVAACGLGALGAALGRRAMPPRANPIDWTNRLAWVVAGTTLLMIAAGGIVTGLEAGLAVNGWIDGEARFIVLFPISSMRRDVGTFVEHGHRLWGLLVGWSTIVLVVHLFLVETRGWVKGLAVAILLAVIGQGVMGGLRVNLGVSDRTMGGVAFGIAHGVFGPVILAGLVGLGSITSATWKRDDPPVPHASAGTDRALTTLLLIAVLVQIAAGTTFRQLQPVAEAPRGLLMASLHGHSFLGSLVVVVMVLLCGVRAWGLYGELRPVKVSGTALVHTMVLQVVLGVASFVAVPKGPRPAGDTIGPTEVVLTSAHQLVGAVLLSVAVSLWLWERRLVGKSALG